MKRAWLIITGALLLAAAPQVHAASFDCAKARSKLNRMICADAELSALDSQVWDTFGVHLKTLSPAVLAHVREQHLIWRRQRGWFDDTISAISEDYRRHLAWLTHPLLSLEGRFESDAGHTVRVEMDTSATDRLAVQGEGQGGWPGGARSVMTARSTFAWVAPAEGEIENHIVRDSEAAATRPPLLVRDGIARLIPTFFGAPPGPVQQCRIALRFETETLTLQSEGACGAALAGVYRRPAPAATPPVPVRPRKAGAAAVPAVAPTSPSAPAN